MEQNKIKSLAECKKAVALQQGYDSFEQWTASLKVSGGYKAHERLIDEANAMYYSPENQQPAQPVEGDLDKKSSWELGLPELKSIGYDNDNITYTETWIAAELYKKYHNQQPSAVQWLTDGDINKIFYSESDSFDAGDYSFSYLSKQGFINALNELRTRLTTANQVDPVEFSKWVLDQYTSTKIRYALNDRMTYKEDVVSWSKLTEIYITEKQNKA